MIRKVEEFINWVLSFVVVEKFNGKLRVCIDSVYLNQVLKRLYYLLFVIEDVFFDLVDVKVFSKVDFKDGFLYVEFDDELSLLTIFQTLWGRFCWKRILFGILFVFELFK